MRLYCKIGETITFNSYRITADWLDRSVGAIVAGCLFQVSKKTKKGYSKPKTVNAGRHEEVVPGLIYKGVPAHDVWTPLSTPLSMLPLEKKFIELEAKGKFTSGDA